MQKRPADFRFWSLKHVDRPSGRSKNAFIRKNGVERLREEGLPGGAPTGIAGFIRPLGVWRIHRLGKGRISPSSG